MGFDFRVPELLNKGIKTFYYCQHLDEIFLFFCVNNKYTKVFKKSITIKNYFQ
jgi:hypothetical protein